MQHDRSRTRETAGLAEINRIRHSVVRTGPARAGHAYLHTKRIQTLFATTARRGHHERASKIIKASATSQWIGAEGRNRTGTSREGQGILSPLRLPVPPPPHAQQNELSTLPSFAQALNVQARLSRGRSRPARVNLKDGLSKSPGRCRVQGFAAARLRSSARRRCSLVEVLTVAQGYGLPLAKGR